MSVRVYVPLTSTGLAGLVAEGRLPGPFRAHAVTDALRVEWSDGDEEGWEYAALMAAAGTSAQLRGGDEAPRRYVVAADVPWKNVASAHVDTADWGERGADEDDELAWFATQEIRDLVEPV